MPAARGRAYASSGPWRVNFRDTIIAGWGRASTRRSFCPVRVTHTSTSMRASPSVRRAGRGAAFRTPARAVASRGEGRGARPRATDEQLIGVGQGVCPPPSATLPSRAGSAESTRSSTGQTTRQAVQAGGQRAHRAPAHAQLTSVVDGMGITQYSGFAVFFVSTERFPCRSGCVCHY